MELLVAPFAERLKAATLGKSYQEILPVLGTIYLNIAFLPKFLLIEGSVQGALRKKLPIDPFVERFKTVTLGESYREILSVLVTIHLNIAFLPHFCCQKGKYKLLSERSCSLLFS